MTNYPLKVLLLLFSFFMQEIDATEQIRERVWIGDGDFQFYGYPLRQLIEDEDFRDIYEIESLCSALWRGYQGYWSISNKELYLTALIKNPCSYDSKKKESFDLKIVLPDYDINKYYYKADWYSGEIVIPISESEPIEGKKNELGHQYYQNQVIVYSVEKGNIKSRVIEYRQR